MSEHNYRFGKVIGEGSFSTVYLAKDVKFNKQYAIKVCEKSFIFREKKQEYIKREKAALLRLNNTTGIIQLVCTFQSSKYLFFVLTYAKNGEILPFIDVMDLTCSRFYAAELLVAIEGMHKRNVIHRDLKPQNLLLDANMHLLIGDFGSSKILPDEDVNYYSINEEDEGHTNNNNSNEKQRKERRESFVGTALYVSPEILKGKKSIHSTDLFSYACILYEFLCKKPAFGSSGENEYMVFQKIQNMDYNFPEDMNAEAQDLLTKLLVLDPEKRLGAADPKEQFYKSIRNHEFFAPIDFDTIYSQTSPLLLLSELKKDAFIISDDIETGLGESQLNRILQLDLASHSSSSNPESLKKLLHDQKKELQWSEFVESNEYIIKYGFIYKRKGLFSRKRMLLLTSSPRLIYIDATNNIKKGEIPFDSSLTCERRNFKIFFVHTPNRIYYLEEPDGNALSWCDAIEEIRDKYFKLKE